MVLVAVSAAAGWVAVGRIADATERALARMESALLNARELASTTADSAAELEEVVGVVGDGLEGTADAVAATRAVSASVRGVLDLVDFIGSVDELQQSLADAEATLVFVEGSLNTAVSTVEAAIPVLHATVVALESVPGEIDAALADAAEARAKLDDQVWLFRLAIVAAAGAFIGGLWGLRANGRRVDELMAALERAPQAA